MKVLTVKNPWAYLIIHGYDFGPELGGFVIKDVENRTWYTDYRGPLLIHCSKNLDSNILLPSGIDWEEYNGHIIGRVNLVDCVKNANSRWAETGLFHWVLKDPMPCKPIPVKGSLGLWEYAGEIMEIAEKEAK
jgi:hypothetical protein